MKIHPLPFLLCLLTACVPLQPVSNAAEAEPPKILSAILRLRGAPADRQVETIEFLLGDGRLKGTPAPPSGSMDRSGDLHCTFLDRRRRPLYQVDLADPQRRELEYADTDGAFHRVTVADSAAVFTLRVPWRADMRFLKIEEWTEGKKKRLLTILTLDPDRL